MSEPNMCSPAQMKYRPQIGRENQAFPGVTANLDQSPAIQYSLSDRSKHPSAHRNNEKAIRTGNSELTGLERNNDQDLRK
jgi:hypothetical protein